MAKTTATLALALGTWAPAIAHAGGVFVGESGSQAMERAGAFVAKADDPTALSLNPAGLVKARSVEVYLGLNLLHFSLTFQRAGAYRDQPIRDVQPAYVGETFPEMENEETVQEVPYLAATFKWRNLAIAAGIFAPASVPGRDFECSVADNLCQVEANGAPAPQRYDIVSQTGVIAFPSLGVAYRVHPRVDLGARVSWGFGHVEARNFPWALGNHPEDPTTEGDFSTDVKDSFMPAFGAGALVRPSDNLEIGISYTSKTQFRGKGTGNARLGPNADPLTGQQVFIEPKPDNEVLCGKGGTTAALKTCLEFDLPQSVTVGLRYVFRDAKGGERADVELDGKWENWGAASDDLITVDGQDTVLNMKLRPTLIRHGFDDVIAVRLGGSYRFDVGANALSVRAGAGYDTAAAPTSWTRVDKDGRARLTLAGGAGFDVGRWRFDAGLAVVIEGEKTVTDGVNPNPSFGNRTQPDPLQPSLERDAQQYHPVNAGRYDSGYIVGLAGVTARF